MIIGNGLHATRPQGRVFAAWRRGSGYTVVELVVVLVLMGILAVNAMPHFFTASRFEEMGFADATASALRYARKLAVVSGCDTRVQLGAGGYRLTQRANTCDSGPLTRAVRRPGGGDWAAASPNGVSVGTLDVYFDAVGQPRDHASGNLLASAQLITVGTRQITLEPITGLVH